MAKFASRVGTVSPMVAKIIANASYMRSLIGNVAFVVPATAAILAVIAAIQNGGLLTTPAWQIFVAIAVLGVFDAFAGFTAAIVFAIATALIAGVTNIGDLRLLLGVLLVAVAPMMMARAFRSRRTSALRGATGVYEVLVDIAVMGFVVYWLGTTMVASLPALAGTTLAVANHVGDFALILSAAAIVRVLIEEIALRLDVNAFSEIDEAEGTAQPMQVKIAMLVIRFGLYLFVASALFGFSWLVVLGCLLFVAPVVIGWFSHLLPNSSLLWKLLPTKLAGLVLILVVSAITLAVSTQAFGTDPDAAAKTFAVLPVPLLALSILGAFGRYGQYPGQARPVTQAKYRLVYRLGGVLILFLAMRLTGIL
jgi:hypothetical protein